MVFVTRFQHRCAVDEVGLELLRHPRQVDITNVYQVESVCPSVVRLARNGVVESRVGDRPRVLIGALLVVVGEVYLHL